MGHFPLGDRFDLYLDLSAPILDNLSWFKKIEKSTFSIFYCGFYEKKVSQVSRLYGTLDLDRGIWFLGGND